MGMGDAGTAEAGTCALEEVPVLGHAGFPAADSSSVQICESKSLTSVPVQFGRARVGQEHKLLCRHSSPGAGLLQVRPCPARAWHLVSAQ